MTPTADIATAAARASAAGQKEHRVFDPGLVRADFPILSTTSRGKPLVYLDNGATTQKPRRVIDAVSRYYQSENANIHRGVYHLSQLATQAYETARLNIARFINAPEPAEVLFTRGTTEAINLVASSWGRTFFKPGDEVIVSAMEHHSNIVPWQMAAQATGAMIRVIPMNDQGELEMQQLHQLLSPRTRFVAVTHLSNSLGTINDVEKITRLAHAVGAKVLIDGAQWVAHFSTDVQRIGCDFYAFSGHKLFGPTGIGVLFGKRECLDQMPPYQGGGDMIESVTFEKTTYAGIPNKFEAGTPNIAGAVGLSTAVEYIESLGFESFRSHEQELLAYATAELSKVPGLRIIGTAAHKASVLSFVLEKPAVSSLQIGMELDAEGIAVRTGHHCCQPVMDRMRISSTARASLAMYNTTDDVDALVAGLRNIVARVSEKPSAAGGATEHSVDEIQYPGPSAPSPVEAAANLAEDFEMLEDRDERNQYVLDLAGRLPNTFALLKPVTPRVPGCMSEVYLVPRRTPGTRDTLEFVADSDAPIVRGLIAILQRLYSGQSSRAVLAFDIEAFFRKIGLDQFITSQRRNGLAGMIQRIHGAAKAISEMPDVGEKP